MDPGKNTSTHLLNKMKRRNYRDTKFESIYARSLITRSISLPISAIGKNIQETIEKNIAARFEGKCVVEGFIQPGSVKIITHSSGMVNSNNIKFEVVFECKICCPVEGMLIQCKAVNITKAGIRAESIDEVPSPVVVFITRDHHYSSKYFLTIQENSTFVVRVIGQRSELHDKYISISAEPVDLRAEFSKKEVAKPSIVFEK